MAPNYGPKIVTDQLELCVDLANPKAYSGSGTSWNDIGKRGNNGTLVNGASYSSENQGIITFDGVDDYANINTVNGINGVTEYSYNLWINFAESAMLVDHRFFWRGNYVFMMRKTSDGRIRTYIRTSTGTNEPFTVAGFAAANTWYNFCTTYDGTNIKLYVNGILIINSVHTFAGPAISAANNRFWIGAAATEFFGECKMGSVSTYFKVLSEDEVKQNYNALKGRYVS
jgi:hypothetical protein